MMKLKNKNHQKIKYLSRWNGTHVESDKLSNKKKKKNSVLFCCLISAFALFLQMHAFY